VKAIMTTALADADNVRRAGQEKCQAYLLKPIGKEKLIDRLKALGLLGEKPNESADHR
jgi:two-component system chemotaxis response regulator CheY